MADIVTVNPDQLGEAAAPTDEMAAVVFAPGGPLQKLPFDKLLAKLIATNLDPNCPVADGKYRAGCGALVAMLEFASGIKAFSVGKPSPVMMRMARKALQLTTDETVMIGDTMGTDILGAGSMGFTTVLTLSGVTRKEDLVHFGYSPDFIIHSIKDLLDEDLFAQVIGNLQLADASC